MSNNSKHYVYIIGNSRGHIKIGVTSSSPASRVKELQTGSSYKLTLLYLITFEHRSGAFEFEKYTHTYLESKGLRIRNNGEWFKMPAKEAVHLFEYVEAVGHLIEQSDPTEGYYTLNPEDRSSPNIHKSSHTRPRTTPRSKTTSSRKNTSPTARRNNASKSNAKQAEKSGTNPRKKENAATSTTKSTKSTKSTRTTKPTTKKRAPAKRKQVARNTAKTPKAAKKSGSFFEGFLAAWRKK